MTRKKPIIMYTCREFPNKNGIKALRKNTPYVDKLT